MTPSTESLFAVRKSWTGRAPLGGREQREFEELLLVRAEDADAAIKHVISRSSVGSLIGGVHVEARAVSLTRAKKVVAQYDREPLTESHMSTGAKLVIRALQAVPPAVSLRNEPAEEVSEPGSTSVQFSKGVGASSARSVTNEPGSLTSLALRVDPEEPGEQP